MKEPIAKELLDLMVCPETHQRLGLAPAELLARLNRLQAEGTLKNVKGDAQGEALQAALVREDQKIAYPVVDGIPMMLIEEGLPLDQAG